MQTGRPQTGQAGPQAGLPPETVGLWPAQTGPPGRAPARTVRPTAGPNRHQAGHMPEPAGLLAGRAGA